MKHKVPIPNPQRRLLQDWLLLIAAHTPALHTKLAFRSRKAHELCRSQIEKLDRQLSKERSGEVNSANPMSEQQWNDPEAEAADLSRVMANNVTPVPGADANITADEAGAKPFADKPNKKSK